jgi:metal-responsive CopG/Arc/MetJ family transcriptional regulator
MSYMRSTDVRTTLNLSDEMARAIDNYWHSEQLRSRNEAIRELLAYALDRKLADKPAKESRR